MNPEFWRSKRVFLTGHTGFKGSWLSLWLNELGAEVTGYALAPPTEPSLFELAGIAARLCHNIADVRDLDALKAALDASRAEIVIHMAAQSLVQASYVDPIGTYATNIMGTVNLLEAVRGHETIRVVLIVTSDKCYENEHRRAGYRETDRLGGNDPYSNSKACVEQIVASYRNSFFAPDRYPEHGVVVATARAGNVIGGGDWAKDRLIPDLMRAFLAGATPVIRSPHAIRPWQHVLEPLIGYVLLCERCWNDGPGFGEGWNFGPENERPRPVSWIADRVTALWGNDVHWRLDDRPHPPEESFLSLDIGKAKSRLGYRPRWNVDAALPRVVEWFRAFAEGKNMATASLTQIEDFMADGGA